MATGNETSLKQLFQGLSGDTGEIMQGTVISTGPLRIRMENDEKLVITDRITIVPRHLTNYTTTCTISWSTESKSGGAGEAAFASHSHGVAGTKSITINNALQVGEKVFVLALSNGKKYYILDRVVN